MQSNIIAAAIQMNSGVDKKSNIAAATRLVEAAADDGAQLIALPELFNCLGPFQTIVQEAEPVPGPTSQEMSRLASRLGITLCAGSLCEQPQGSDKCYNTSLLFGPDGALLAQYRKMHLFDVDLPDGPCIEESKHLSAGHDIVWTDLPLARLGQATCYDLRFSSIFSSLADAGVEIICTPSAFTRMTGKDHWELLLRARAIENQAFLVAPNQSGKHPGDLESFGHSAIVDPWGRILAEAPDADEAIVAAELDAALLDSVRARLPVLKHRQRLA